MVFTMPVLFVKEDFMKRYGFCIIFSRRICKSLLSYKAKGRKCFK